MKFLPRQSVVERTKRVPDNRYDAYVAAAWRRQVDMDGRFGAFLKPDMMPGEYHVARVEGCIWGVM